MNKNPLVQKLSEASVTELDIAFALLKYKEIGIYRKIKALCLSFNLDFEQVVIDLPQENGRLLDRETRHYIHEYMLARAKQFHNNAPTTN